MKEYESQYDEIWDSVPNPNNVKTIIEVGINEGNGTLKLKKRFPSAHIFALDVHLRHSDYTLPYDQIMAKLESVATVVIQESPLNGEIPTTFASSILDLIRNVILLT